MLYITTEKFLRVFGLLSLSELPATEIILPPKEDVPIIEDDGTDTDESAGVGDLDDAEDESVSEADTNE